MRPIILVLSIFVRHRMGVASRGKCEQCVRLRNMMSTCNILKGFNTIYMDTVQMKGKDFVVDENFIVDERFSWWNILLLMRDLLMWLTCWLDLLVNQTCWSDFLVDQTFLMTAGVSYPGDLVANQILTCWPDQTCLLIKLACWLVDKRLSCLWETFLFERVVERFCCW